LAVSTYKFSLLDAKGAQHNYEGEPLPARLGFPLMNTLAGIAIPLLALRAAQGKIEGFEIMGGVQAAVQTIDVDFAMKLLGTVRRDGNILVPEVFDDAYRANYTECLAAAYEVVRYNGFLLEFISLPPAAQVLAKSKAMAQSSGPMTGDGPTNED
jgi:hypothetical protein